VLRGGHPSRPISTPHSTHRIRSRVRDSTQRQRAPRRGLTGMVSLNVTARGRSSRRALAGSSTPALVCGRAQDSKCRGDRRLCLYALAPPLLSFYRCCTPFRRMRCGTRSHQEDGLSEPVVVISMKFTDNELLLLVERGVTASEISRHLGVTRQAVSKRLQSLGIEATRHMAKVAQCGTNGGYAKHYREGTEPCEGCRLAKREDDERRRRATGMQPLFIAPCGTISAYRRHLRRGEEPCDDCRMANTERSRRVYAMRSST
jgi:hypothetical protein